MELPTLSTMKAQWFTAGLGQLSAVYTHATKLFVASLGLFGQAW